MKIAYFNDTSKIDHVGCQAVSQAHAKELSKHDVLFTHRVSEFLSITSRIKDPTQLCEHFLTDAKLVAELEKVDGIVINGEGTIHHGAGVEYLAIGWVAKGMGKKVYIINSVMQDIPNYWHSIMQTFDDITVRDKFSSMYLDKLDVPHRLVLDSFLQADWKINTSLDFRNNMVFGDCHHSRPDVNAAMASLYRTPSENIHGGRPKQQIPLTGWGKRWDEAVIAMKTANCYITGRHHGVYLAGQANKPFVACPGNSWKVEGLIKQSGINIPICTNSADIIAGYNFAQSNPNAFEDFHNWLISNMPLDTFKVINESLVEKKETPAPTKKKAPAKKKTAAKKKKTVKKRAPAKKKTATKK